MDKFLKHIIIIEIYTLLTIIVFHKVFVLGIDKYIIGDYGDGWQFIWNIWWVKKHVLLEGSIANLFHTDYLFYPNGVTLVFHTLSPLNGLFAFPLTFFFNIIMTYNILVLASFIITGYLGYLLANFFLKDKFLSFLTGLFISFSSYHTSKVLGYFNLLKIEYFILFLYFYFKLVGKNETNKLKYAIMSGIALTLVGLSEFQYLYFGFIFIGIALIYFSLLYIKESKQIEAIQFILTNFLIFLISCSLLSPWLFSMYKEYSTSDWMKKYGRFKSTNLENFFLPNPFSIGYTLTPIFEREYKKSEIFWYVDSPVGFGILTLPLTFVLVMYFIFKKNIERTSIFFLLISLIGIILAIGSKINDIIPFYSLVGSPSRFAVFPSIFIPLLLFSLVKKMKVKAKDQAIILLILLIEFIFFTFPTMYSYYTYSYYTLEIPKVLENIRNDPDNFTILNLPPSLNTHALFYQTIHEKKMIDGHVSRIPKTSLLFIEKLSRIAKEENFSEFYKIAKELRLKYIIAHPIYNHERFYFKLLDAPFLIKKYDGSIKIYELQLELN